MKIAIIADVHGNAHALDAVLEDIAAEKVDQIVGAGDLVGASAFEGAPRVWRTLLERSIPWVKGNEEARILDIRSAQPTPLFKDSVQFKPMQYRARQFSAADIDIMKNLPLTLSLPGPQGQDVLVCHATPCSLQGSPIFGIDAQMAACLQGLSEKVIVVGHLHSQWHTTWQDKLLVMAGSAGLPLRGALDEVDYLILTWRQGGWHFEYKLVHYDAAAAIKEALESDFIAQTGPIGWLMLDEMLTEEDRMVPFLTEFCPAKRPVDVAGWARLARAFLISKSRWEAIRPYIGQ